MVLGEASLVKTAALHVGAQRDGPVGDHPDQQHRDGEETSDHQQNSGRLRPGQRKNQKTWNAGQRVAVQHVVDHNLEWPRSHQKKRQRTDGEQRLERDQPAKVTDEPPAPDEQVPYFAGPQRPLLFGIEKVRARVDARAIAMSGWILRDQRGHRITWPPDSASCTAKSPLSSSLPPSTR